MSTKAEKLKAAARTPRPPPPANMDDFVRGAPAQPAAKRGRGRPPRAEERQPVTLHLAPELAKALRIAKIEEGREMSEIVADALAAYLKNS